MQKNANSLSSGIRRDENQIQKEEKIEGKEDLQGEGIDVDSSKVRSHESERGDERKFKPTILDDKPIKSLGKNLYDIETAIAMDQQAQEANPDKTVKRKFLKRKEVYNPTKSIEKARKGKQCSHREDVKEYEGKEIFAKESTKSLEKNAEESRENVKGDPAENSTEKPKRDFLKRKLQKVESKKLDWQGISHRIDCWGQKQEPQEDKEMLIQKQKSLSRARQQKKAEGNKPIEPHSIEELKNLYLEYHDNTQGNFMINVDISKYFEGERRNSSIPVLIYESVFFRNYSDDTYEVTISFNTRMSCANCEMNISSCAE
eukprot:TRINITY_DN7103_c0_g1_i20.p1 TRINITY_DN7103_c0_g1~~TRINITY_DN7103_c0_g1_i20.p1  ORF type:complete len:332 (-),score=69.59 TRINITY_DN7103_c0_g1_i20:161-1108(-)